MASWTNQSTSSLLPGEPWTSAKALAAFENPTALAEGASGAPVLSTGWHSYNRTNVGDSGTGVYYSFATDGAVATAETPNFENNYEYRLLGVNLGISANATASTWVVDALVGGSWVNIATTSTASSTVVTSDRIDFDCWICSPRRSRPFASTVFAGYWDEGSGSTFGGYRTTQRSSSTSITRARVRYIGQNIGRGDLYLLRRRED